MVDGNFLSKSDSSSSKINKHAKKLSFNSGHKMILVEINELSMASDNNIITQKYYDFAKGMFVYSIVVVFI